MFDYLKSKRAIRKALSNLPERKRPEMLRLLLIVKSNGPRIKGNGICGAVCNLHPGAPLVISNLALLWPKHSGEYVYPVPHSCWSPGKAYHYNTNLWDKSTEYGRNRWELLDFLIECLEINLGVKK